MGNECLHDGNRIPFFGDLQTAKGEAQESARRSEVLLQRVAHELRTPMNIVAGEIRGIRDVVPGNRFDIMEFEMQNGAIILNDIIDVVDFLPKGAKVSMTTVDMSKMLRSLVRFESRLRRGIECELQVPMDLPLVRSDVMLLETFLRQLLGNAMCYCQPGSAVVRIPCELAPQEIFSAPKVGRILLVDDNALNLKVLQKICEKLGHKCVPAETGLDAVKMVIRERPDMVLVDIQTPVLDGLEATKLIRQWEKRSLLESILIVAVTAHGTPSYESTCKAAGMNAMLPKPVDIE